MPVWGWILLIAVLSALAVVAVGAIVRATHPLPADEPLPGNAENFAAPLPVDVAAEDEPATRDLDGKEPREELPSAR